MAGRGESAMPEAAAEVETKLECFDLAFNSEFSDRLLRIEVVPGDDVAEGSLTDCARHRKVQGEKRQRIDSSPTMADTPALRVKTLHISSVILAARSAFFLKLFSNGMKESDQTHTTIRISDLANMIAQENAFMELLSFMYIGKLTTTESTLLLDILMAADKFEVPSCMRHCSQLLISLPMTIESALLYLEHGCSISQAAEVQRVIGAAKQFLAKEYTDFDKFCDEAMNISLAGIEAIFSSTDIHVISEEHVFKFLLHWARTRYLEPEERRKIWSSHLLPLVRFSHMTGTTLQAILACTDTVIDLDHEELTKRVTEVLLCKGYRAQLEGSLAAVTTTAERAYVIKPMKVVAFDQPCQQVVVYWDLTRQECSRIFPSGEIISHPFHLAGQRFSLMVVCKMEEQDEIHSFAVLLGIHGNPKGSTCMTVDHEFAARTGLSGKFVSHFGRKHTFTDDPASECEVLFRAPWSSFIADNSHFIDGVLHLRADITVVEQPAVQS